LLQEWKPTGESVWLLEIRHLDGAQCIGRGIHGMRAPREVSARAELRVPAFASADSPAKPSSVVSRGQGTSCSAPTPA
jgi:hypothetical protein